MCHYTTCKADAAVSFPTVICTFLVLVLKPVGNSNTVFASEQETTGTSRDGRESEWGLT